MGKFPTIDINNTKSEGSLALVTLTRYRYNGMHVVRIEPKICAQIPELQTTTPLQHFLVNITLSITLKSKIYHDSIFFFCTNFDFSNSIRRNVMFMKG